MNGSAQARRLVAGVVRARADRYLYHYAFWMIIGLAVLLGWLR